MSTTMQQQLAPMVAFNSATPSDGHAAGVANTTYVNLGVDYKATKDLTLSADVYGFWASETGCVRGCYRSS